MLILIKNQKIIITLLSLLSLFMFHLMSSAKEAEEGKEGNLEGSQLIINNYTKYGIIAKELEDSVTHKLINFNNQKGMPRASMGLPWRGTIDEKGRYALVFGIDTESERPNIKVLLKPNNNQEVKLHDKTFIVWVQDLGYAGIEVNIKEKL